LGYSRLVLPYQSHQIAIAFRPNWSGVHPKLPWADKFGTIVVESILIDKHGQVIVDELCDSFSEAELGTHAWQSTQEPVRFEPRAFSPRWAYELQCVDVPVGMEQPPAFKHERLKLQFQRTRSFEDTALLIVVINESRAAEGLEASIYFQPRRTLPVIVDRLPSRNFPEQVISIAMK